MQDSSNPTSGRTCRGRSSPRRRRSCSRGARGPAVGWAQPRVRQPSRRGRAAERRPHLVFDNHRLDGARPAQVSATSSGREIEWPQLGIGRDRHRSDARLLGSRCARRTRGRWLTDRVTLHARRAPAAPRERGRPDMVAALLRCVAAGPRPYRKSTWRRALNALVRPLARLGLTGPRTHLLTVPGRSSGRLWSTPVSIVAEAGERWLVAPYGDRNWVRTPRRGLGRAAARTRSGTALRRGAVPRGGRAGAAATTSWGGSRARSSASASTRRTRSGWPRRHGTRCLGCDRHDVRPAPGRGDRARAVRARGARVRGRAVEAASATARRLAVDPPGRSSTSASPAGGSSSRARSSSGRRRCTGHRGGDPGRRPRAGGPRASTALQDEFPEAVSLPIATSATVSGGRPGTSSGSRRWRGSASCACALAGVPAVEVRAISNDLGEGDRARWMILRGLEALDAALPRLLAVLAE